MLLWTLLTFIVWTKSVETFLKISKSNSFVFSFLGELSLILVLLCIYWIHHPCLTCSSVSYWGVIPLCTLMNFTISKASGGSVCSETMWSFIAPFLCASDVHTSPVCPAGYFSNLIGNVLVIHCYFVCQFVFVICLSLLRSPAGLTSGSLQRQLSLTQSHTSSRPLFSLCNKHLHDHDRAL